MVTKKKTTTEQKRVTYQQKKGPLPSKIVPHLWFDHQAAEAAKLYTSILPDSKVESVYPLPVDTPSGPAGSVDIVEFTLFGQRFMSISAGPLFHFNPSISLIVNFDPLFFGPSETGEKEARRKLDEAWEKLSAGGNALMPIGKYPFSERYGWVEDKYGLTWQLMLAHPDREPRPPIVPSLLFTENNTGKAEEAVDFYMTVFRNAKRGTLVRYEANQPPDKEGTVMYSDFMLENQWFAAMDSAREHGFSFNEAVSLMVNCETQKDIDYYWERLSAVPQAEQCGWLKDRYGVSWQIVPAAFQAMMKDADQDRGKRVMEAMLDMKKIDISALEKAYRGGD